MKVYLNTCIISGLAKEDIDLSELEALSRILELQSNQTIEIVTSSVAKEELEKIPENFKRRHMMVYNLLKNVPAVDYLQLDFFSVTGLRVKQTKEFGALYSLLKDTGDAKHIYQAFRSGIDFFITVDSRSILNKYYEIKEICNMKVYLPSDFVEQYG